MPEITILPERAPAIPRNLIDRWARVPVTVISDVVRGDGLLPQEIRLLRAPGERARFAGPARTAACAPPDFGSVLFAVDAARAGEVLVIAAGGDTNTASIGEVLCGALQKRKVVGLVCDGAVRDVAGLATLDDFPVFCRAVTAHGPLSKGAGDVNAEVSIGGVTIAPGDLLIGDEDGIIRLDAGTAAEAIDTAEAQVANEDSWVRRLGAGETLEAIFGLAEPSRPR